jgi:hypothetical protein
MLSTPIAPQQQAYISSYCKQCLVPNLHAAMSTRTSQQLKLPVSAGIMPAVLACNQP